MSEPIRLWKEHDAMAAIVNGVKSPQFTLDRRALEDFAYPDEEYAALPAAEFAALSARVAKLEAEQSEARKRAARLEAALRPFAVFDFAGSIYAEYVADGDTPESVAVLCAYANGEPTGVNVTMADFSNARAALEDKP